MEKLPTDAVIRYKTWIKSSDEEDYNQFCLALVPFVMGFLKRSNSDWMSAIWLQLHKEMRKYDPSKSSIFNYVKFVARHCRTKMAEEEGAIRKTVYGGKAIEVELADYDGCYEGLGWDEYQSPSYWG